MVFATFSSVDLERETTWKDKLFLSFDIEWASDGALVYIIDIVEAVKPIQNNWQKLCRVAAPEIGVRSALAKLVSLGNGGKE